MKSLTLLALPVLTLLPAGCVDSLTSGRGEDPLAAFTGLACSIPRNELFDGGVGIDGIPSLQNPPMVDADDPRISYLHETAQFPDPRVVGVVVDGQAYAVPHNILWWHEIVNLDLSDGLRLAFTYCPLTGSSLVFDRGEVGGAELGVSGLIFKNNLVIFDRRSPASLYPQMMRGGRCGPADGLALGMYPAMEMRWSRWKALHPNTLVVSGNTGFSRNYARYPYGAYEQSRELLFPQAVPGVGEERRPMKERVLGIPSLVEGDYGGVALPFGELALASNEGVAAIYTASPQGEILVLWDQVGQGGMAFRPVTLDGRPVTIRTEEGRFVDEETGSEWTVDGRAISGVLEGAVLMALPEAYVAFWFAWEAIQTETTLWTT